MERSEWRKLIYDSYMTNIYGEGHIGKKRFEIHNKYFKRNYLSYMPKNKNAKILELGAGIGQFYYFCRRNGYNNYIGLDMSDENIDYIKKHVSSKVDIRKKDMFEFFKESDKGAFDVVVLNDVIEHLTKDEIFDMLLGVKEILRPSGVFFIKTPNMANPIVNTAGRYIAFDHEIGFTEASLKEVIRACGYSSVKVIGTDIYVYNPVISVISRIISKLIGAVLWMLSALYGRISLKIFEKEILAIAYK